MTDRTRCTAPDCRRVLYAHSYCKAHYERWRRGAPMVPIRAALARRPGRRVRVTLWLSPAALRYWERVGAPGVEDLVESRALTDEALKRRREDLSTIAEALDLHLNPPAEQEP